MREIFSFWNSPIRNEKQKILVLIFVVIVVAEKKIFFLFFILHLWSIPFDSLKNVITVIRMLFVTHTAHFKSHSERETRR